MRGVLAAFPRVDAHALVGRDALERLERQAAALKMELERRGGDDERRLRRAGGRRARRALLARRAFGGALRNVADALFRASSDLARLEEGEASPHESFSRGGSGRLDASFSLITQMSWPSGLAGAGAG